MVALPVELLPIPILKANTYQCSVSSIAEAIQYLVLKSQKPYLVLNTE